MDINLAPTTELEAINLMLDTIGESPVNSVENNGVVDAVKARQQLNAWSRAVQAKGWNWNTEEGFTLTRSMPAKEITLPQNCLRVDTCGADAGTNVTQRGKRLYNKDTHSFTFDKNVTVNMVVFLAFEELPETARQFIYLTAARKFQENSVGSQELSTFNRRDELRAWADLLNEEGETGDYNIFDQAYQPGGVLAR